MSAFWNERYSTKEYIYGEEPNIFLKYQLKNLKPGKIIFPCEGEGRNAVYAASLGWHVQAFDSSEAGRYKAMLLAAGNGVTIDYKVEDAVTTEYAPGSVDVVAFIYAHFPPDIRKTVHQKAITWLKPGGIIIIEAFNTLQLQNNSGGPKELPLLYTEKMIKEDFKDLKKANIQSTQTVLKEGRYHEGLADVIRFTGIKAYKLRNRF